MNARVQAVVDKSLKAEAEEIFADYGLNFTEGIKLLLSNFVKGRISLNISASDVDEVVKLSTKKKAEYEKDMADILVGRNVHKSTDNNIHQELMRLADAD